MRPQNCQKERAEYNSELKQIVDDMSRPRTKNFLKKNRDLASSEEEAAFRGSGALRSTFARDTNFSNVNERSILP